MATTTTYEDRTPRSLQTQANRNPRPAVRYLRNGRWHSASTLASTAPVAFTQAMAAAALGVTIASSPSQRATAQTLRAALGI